jgi:hypothetical protein
MPAIKLGQPFPHAIQSGGMTTFMKTADRANEGVDIVLVISLRQFHPVEVKAFVEEPIRLDDRFHEIGVVEQAELVERTACWRIPRLRSAKRGAVSWQDGGERSNWQ